MSALEIYGSGRHVRLTGDLVEGLPADILAKGTDDLDTIFKIIDAHSAIRPVAALPPAGVTAAIAAAAFPVSKLAAADMPMRDKLRQMRADNLISADCLQPGTAGGRSKLANTIACAAVRLGFNDEQIAEALTVAAGTAEWAAEKGERQIPRTISYAREEAAKEIGPNPNATFAHVPSTVAQMTATAIEPIAPNPGPAWRVDATSDWPIGDIPRRPWLAPQYLMRGKVTALIGAPEAGKSGLALCWAIALDLGRIFGDFVPIGAPGQLQSRKVMVVNAEDDEEEQRRRIAAMMQAIGRPVSDLGDRLIRVGPGRGTAALFALGADGAVIVTAAFAEMITALKAHAVEVLFLDPLVELMGGLDENSNAIMGQVFAILRSLAADCEIAICVVHHTKKGVAVPGNLEAARGGGALGGSIRIGMTLTAMSDTEATALGVPVDKRKQYVRLDNAKQSYGPPAEGASWFHRYPVTLANGDTAPALEPWSPPRAQAADIDQLAAIAEAIKAGADGVPYSAKLSADRRSIKHLFDTAGIAGKIAQGAAILALRTGFGLVEADYQRRDAQGNRRGGSARGLRIGTLPHAEWLSDPLQAQAASLISTGSIGSAPHVPVEIEQ